MSSCWTTVMLRPRDVLRVISKFMTDFLSRFFASLTVSGHWNIWRIDERTHFITIWVSEEEKGLFASFVDEGPAGDRKAARRASEDTVIVISLFELDCMR